MHDLNTGGEELLTSKLGRMGFEPISTPFRLRKSPMLLPTRSSPTLRVPTKATDGSIRHGCSAHMLRSTAAADLGPWKVRSTGRIPLFRVLRPPNLTAKIP